MLAWLCLPFFLVVLLSIISYVFFRQRAPPLKAGDVIVITGASSGIGEHCAYEFARRKMSLVLAARRQDRLEVVANKCKQLGAPHVLVQPTDVTRDADCKALVDATMSKFKRIDVLLLNAGMGCYGEFSSFSSLEPLITTMVSIPPRATAVSAECSPAPPFLRRISTTGAVCDRHSTPCPISADAVGALP